MPVNAHPDYLAAEKEYLIAKDLEEKITALKKMISLMPGHKGAENLRANLRFRLKKLEEKFEKGKRKTKTSKPSIKKEEMQAVIVGFTNSGKSTLLSSLTNASPEIAQHEFTTKKPEVGTMDIHGTKIQLIEIPAIESENYDRSVVNGADIILILVNDLNSIKEIEKELQKAEGNKIIIFNNKNDLDERKLEATLKSKKYNFVIVNLKDIGKNDRQLNSYGDNYIKNSTGLANGFARQNGNINNEWGRGLNWKNWNGLNKLKEKIFLGFNKIRVFTKEPGHKTPSEKPFVLEKNATIEDVAKKIFHKDVIIKEIKIWGPSSKFPGQIVGLKHELKDLDVVEFKTK